MRHHDVREVRKAAKKAKTFETQKLLKKLKDLRRKAEKPNEITDAEAQLDAIKHITLDVIADTALRTKMNKDHILSTNEDLQHALSMELLPSPIASAAAGSHLAKVQSRLLSSKVLASEISIVIGGIKATINPAFAAAQDAASEGESDADVPAVPRKTKRVSADKSTHGHSMSVPEKNEEDGGNAEEDENILDDGWESGTISGGDQASEDEWESGSVDDVHHGTKEDGDYSSGSEGNLAAPSSPPLPNESKPHQGKAKTVGSQSTFLPSLAVGFARGDSDSDWSESEAKDADGIKKNRRGQRARRAIWEKKFGKNANHVKRYQDDPSRRERPTERRRGSQPLGQRNSDRPRKRDTSNQQHQQPPDAGWNRREPSNSHTKSIVGTRSTIVSSAGSSQRNDRHDERPLHPSWEAKKKQKTAGIVPSQGKKIVFSS
ncbi:hypothetical protein SERLA73DRAFT_161183 [Serpula lacrymans var. lacrymans S7.3]|uniref:Bud22 domain-containing protein n=2 Tax=Serpula lacrymans var. lacrymans TaxID=341189 RepID=F8PZR5_SERL3|nr:uncharacterized protein SERLADRAFT_416221 [Serpula lacrymans var. lacrymans S7.9]EGN98387.1 hypothetical protein SERLA73DRAFT_161183 [Serpula lacrymans var. lacrymans S7.3]EGO23939.1 hypothetical protein SERLADRAFT_416221 [Serpula lacrymans var. lacrymans S7.9]